MRKPYKSIKEIYDILKAHVKSPDWRVEVHYSKFRTVEIYSLCYPYTSGSRDLSFDLTLRDSVNERSRIGMVNLMQILKWEKVRLGDKPMLVELFNRAWLISGVDVNSEKKLVTLKIELKNWI